MLNTRLIGVSSPESDLEKLQAYQRVSTKYSDIDTKVYQGTLKTKLSAFAQLMAYHKVADILFCGDRDADLEALA